MSSMLTVGESSVLEEMLSMRPGDFEHDLALVRAIRGAFPQSGARCRDRLLAILSLGPNAEPKALASLPRLLEQTRQAGFSVDALIGLDGDVPVRKLEGTLKKRERVHVYASPLWSESHGDQSVLHKRPCPTSPEVLIEDSRQSLDRIFWIHHLPSSSGGGKNRVLKTIAAAVMRSAQAGTWGDVPCLTVDMDDDAHLSVAGDPDVNPISRLHDELSANTLQAIGGRMNTVPFVSHGKTRVPNLHADPDPNYAYLDGLQTRVAPFLPGCATMGHTDLLLAARYVIGHRYPGSWSDDLHRTLYVKGIGAPWAVSSSVDVTNERRTEDTRQIMRWLQGTLSLRAQFGRKTLETLRDKANHNLPFPPEGIVQALQELMREPHQLTLQGTAQWQ